MDASTRVELHTGRRMPVLGLGTWQLTRETAATVEGTLEEGYRMIDTAVDYGSQRGIGEALRRTKIARADIFVVTKVEENDDAYDGVQRDLDEMQLDYADLTLIHRPPPSGAGEALWRGLMRARDEGLVRDIGVSNYSAKLVDTLAEATREMPVVNQIEWSPFGFSDALLHHHRERNVVVQAYSPLTRGNRLGDERLARVAEKYGRTPAQVLLRWNLQKGTVPLPKANRPEHYEENFDVFDFEIAEGEMSALDGLNKHYSSLGSLPYV
jgi:2,5-diketo-D-gluconate reductase A